MQNEGRHMWGPKEVKKARRSEPSQWYHSGDATRNTRRESEERKERENERKRETEQSERRERD